MLAKLSGYSEKIQVDHHMERRISQMGDAELHVEIQNALAKREDLEGEPSLRVVSETAGK